MNKSKLSLIGKLLKIVSPLFLIMLNTIIMGVIGFICSTGIPVLGGVGLLIYLGEIQNITYSQVFGIAVAFAVLRGILRYAEQYSGHYIAFRVLAIIRDRIFTVLRKLAPAKLEGKDKGNLITLITTDIELLEVFFAHTIAPVCIAFFMAIITLSIVGHYSIVAMIILLAGYLATSIFIPRLITRLGEESGKKFRGDFANLTSYVLESLKGIRESMQYDNTKERIDKMQDMTAKLEGTNEELKKYEELTRALSDLTVIATGVIIFLYTAHQSHTNGASLESVIIPTTLALSSFGPFIALSNLSNNLLQTLSSGQRVIALLEEEPQVEEIYDKKDALYDDVKMQNVDFSYEEKSIFKDMSMDFNKNKIYGILGRSGCGKSTMLKLIMRFWDVNSGSVKIGDEDVRNINTKSLRNIQSYVTQETMLFQGSIAENIKIAKNYATDEEVIEAAKKASIHEFIDKLPEKYDTPIGEAMNQLSAGEKQRISMARAFLHGAPILLLDEPTSNLDSLNEAVILKTIKKESQDKTVIVVSHRKSTLSITKDILKFGTQ